MSTLVVNILCPHYEDNETYGPAKHYLKHWPDMWPEEAMADRALWLEYQEQRKRYPLIGRLGTDWTKRNIVIKALCSMAEECNWEVKNVWDMEVYHVGPIYKTDGARDIELPKHVPTASNPIGMEIDGRLLADILGDLIPGIARTTTPPRRVSVPQGEKLQDFALATLAKEYGWQQRKAGYYNNLDIYQT